MLPRKILQKKKEKDANLCNLRHLKDKIASSAICLNLIFPDECFLYKGKGKVSFIIQSPLIAL